MLEIDYNNKNLTVETEYFVDGANMLIDGLKIEYYGQKIELFGGKEVKADYKMSYKGEKCFVRVLETSVKMIYKGKFEKEVPNLGIAIGDFKKFIDEKTL